MLCHCFTPFLWDEKFWCVPSALKVQLRTGARKAKLLMGSMLLRTWRSRKQKALTKAFADMISD